MVFTTVFQNNTTLDKEKNHNLISASGFTKVIISDEDEDNFERETHDKRGFKSFFIDNKSTADIEFYLLGNEFKFLRCNAGQTRNLNNLQYRQIFWKLRNSNITPGNSEIIAMISTENLNANVSGTYHKRIYFTSQSTITGDGVGNRSITFSAGNDRQMHLMRASHDAQIAVVTTIPVMSYVDTVTVRDISSFTVPSVVFVEISISNNPLIRNDLIIGSGDSIEFDYGNLDLNAVVRVNIFGYFEIGD